MTGFRTPRELMNHWLEHQPLSHYPVPARCLEHEIEAKKSRFIARAGPATNRSEAMAMIDGARRDYPDARHHCWAFSIGPPHSAATAGMSDDGEPSGTAGKPIMNVIEHRGIGDVVVVVSRYFGGVKLGAGGLVRAYSAATRDVLERLPLVERQPLCHYRASLDFALEESLRRWADSRDVHILDVEYSERVCLVLAIPQSAEAALKSFAAARNIDLTRA
ncbi:MAG: YigZ family protein [Halothiobacillaceae bacterium]